MAEGLYRQVCVVFLDEAAARGDRVNFSAGAGSFKRFRGARACTEYDAVFDSHLPYWRRLPWRLAAMGGRWQRLAARRKRSPVVVPPPAAAGSH